jgi:hypothetical protein
LEGIFICYKSRVGNLEKDWIAVLSVLDWDIFDLTDRNLSLKKNFSNIKGNI